jgi:hypothetical protein
MKTPRFSGENSLGGETAKAVVHFQVTAHNAAGESARSAVASVTLS